MPRHSKVIIWHVDLVVITISRFVVDAVGSNDAVQIRVTSIEHNHARLQTSIDDFTGDDGSFTLLALEDSLNRESSPEQENANIIEFSL